MTNLLIRLFVKNYGDTGDRKVRTAYGNLAGIVGILCNVLLFAGKYIAGTLFGSIAIAADAINNLSDASSNVVTLLGFRLGAKKPDAKHPYGHARYEYLSGLVVCVIILAIGLSLARESIVKILSPTAVTFSWLVVIVLAVSICVKLWMCLFNRKIGKLIDSETLIATAADSRNDVISTGAVLLATILCHITGLAILDGIMGLVVALFILYSGVGLVRDTLSPLLGEAPNPKLVAHIQKKAEAYPGVIGIHDLMIHDYGPGNLFASLHVEFPAEADVIKAHDLIDNMEHDFLEEDHILMTIHYDPIVTADAAVGELRAYLSNQVKTIDEHLSIHDLRMVPGVTHTNVVFDCLLPPGFQGDQRKIADQLQAVARTKDQTYNCVVNFEQSYVDLPDT